MASNNLAGTSPSNFYPALLHIGSGNLPAGTQARLGDGTPTPLWLDANGTGTRLADGRIIRHVGRLGMVATAVTKSAQTSVPETLSWSDASALEAGTYRLRGTLIASTSDPSWGVYFMMNGAGIAGTIGWGIPGFAGSATGWSDAFLPPSSPSYGPFPIDISGVLWVTDGAAVPGLLFNSESTTGGWARLEKGSWIELQRISGL